MEAHVPMLAPHMNARVQQDSRELTVKSLHVQLPRVPTVVYARLKMATLCASVQLATQVLPVKLRHVLPHPV